MSEVFDPASEASTPFADPAEPTVVADLIADPVSDPVSDSAPEHVAEPVSDSAPERVAESKPDLVEPEAAEPVPAVTLKPEIGATATSDTPVPEPVRPPSDAGKIVSGVITEISADEVCLTLSDGRAAVINRHNFDDQKTDPTTVYNVGDRTEGAILTREDPLERVVLSRAWAIKKSAWEVVTSAAEKNEPISGTIKSASKRGVVVDAGVRGFVPSSHLELSPVANMSSYVGQTLDFKVLQVDVAKERLVLSRRSILLKEQRKGVHDLLAQMTAGDTRTGTVSSLTDYGAFVDLGGVNGLVHLSELSWHRVRHPSEAVSVGEEGEVTVLDVKVKKRRVSLSIRRLVPDPLTAVSPGDLVEGPVTRLVDFGAFVDVGGVEGLVHLSELTEYRVSTPEEIVTPGEIVRVKVLSVDKKRRRIELSIRQAVSGDFG